MDFETVVRKRRMCQEYFDKDVPQEKIERILNIALRHPSAGHTEPQEFIVARNQQVKETLAHAALGQMFIAQAPWVIVVISDTRRSARRYGQRGVNFFSITDGSFVAMLILLTVVDEGLGLVSLGPSTIKKCKTSSGCRRRSAPSESSPSVIALKSPNSFRVGLESR